MVDIMGIKFTDPQIQHLMEYGDENWADAEFEDAAARDKAFSAKMSALKSANDKGLKGVISNPSNDLTDLANSIRSKLKARGFIEVHTPIFVSKAALAKMTITADHPLYKQVFFIDDKRALRPMHAMNLYAVMRKLRDHTDGPVKIFEIGSCFRKESKSSTHLEEFTMLNLVELGPDGDAMEHLKTYIGDIMDAVGLEYETTREESDVYVETLDVEINGTEVASGAIGPHKLDPAHDIHEPWAGVGFGLERLLMLKNGKSNVRKTGKSTTYVNGYKMD
jgi:phenylalanyl-tRNA synthetase alpha chain